MENKIELLKKLGFSDEYLKFVSDESNKNKPIIETHDVFDVVTVTSSDITYPVIDKTEEPVNSYVN